MSTRSTAPRIALALAGGGPLGAIYEIGALCALEESLQGIAFNRLHHYVGVSAGGFIAAALANGFTPRELCTSFIENSGSSEVFDPAWLMVPAWGEFGHRLAHLPRLAASALWRTTGGRKPLTHAIEQLGPALPTGLLSSEEIHRRLAEVFSRPGRTNDFRQLPTRLTLVATNLDTGEAAPFGRPGLDHIPISRAVQASAALPGLFPPVRIGDVDFVDGALKKTMHASVALDEGVDLMLCINPLVPFAADGATRRPGDGIPRIVEGGLPAVLSQTFRSMIHSRMVLAMNRYERIYPHTDIVLFEPDPRDPEIYLANTFSYRQRRHLAEHAYQQTRAQLRARRAVLEPKLARHGVRLRDEVLQQERRLLAPQPPRSRVGEAMLRLERTLDDLGRLVQAGPGKGAA